MFLYIFSFREGKFVLLKPIALNWFTFKISLHSLHGYHKQQNINYFPCNVLVFLMSLMSLGYKSDMSDMAFLLVIAR